VNGPNRRLAPAKLGKGLGRAGGGGGGGGGGARTSGKNFERFTLRTVRENVTHRSEETDNQTQT